MTYYVAVLLGCLLYLLLQLNGAYTLPDFKFSLFIKTNWIPTLINLVFGGIMVFAKDEIVNIYPITFVSAVMLGIGGQALLKKLSNIFSSKVDTVISF